MKRFILLLCFFLTLNVFGKVQKVIFSDQAVFKIEEKVFLLSDIERYSKSLKLFRCLNPDALVLEILDLDKKNQEIIPEFLKLGEMDLMKESAYLNKVLKLMKLNTFIAKQSVELDKSSLGSFKGDVCGISLGAFENWNKELREFFLIEGFWLDRFSINSYKLSDHEIDEIKAKNSKDIKPDILKKLMDTERERLGKASAQALVKTIDKQISHELFF